MAEQRFIPILIAAEVPSDREGLRKALADAGYRKVLTVTSGPEAVAAMAWEFLIIMRLGVRMFTQPPLSGDFPGVQNGS